MFQSLLEDARIVMRKKPRLDRDYVGRWLREIQSAAGEALVARLDALEREQ